MRRAALLVPLLALVCGGASGASPPPPSALALLRDGTLVRIGIPTGTVIARSRIGPSAVSRSEAGRFLATGAAIVYAVDPAPRAVLVAADARTLRIRWRRALERGVRYRGVVLAGKRLYAYGYRPGRLIDEQEGAREGAAVLTAVGLGGDGGGSWTIRPARTHNWWEWWGSASADGRTLALSWHGGCYPDSVSLCTSGADLVDVSGAAPEPCAAAAGAEGCLADVHGAVEPYDGGWIAATGGADLLVKDAAGRTTSTVDTGLRKEHLMSFALEPRTRGLFVLATCYLGATGLRAVSPATGGSRLLARRVCGSDLTPGPRGTLLASAAPLIWPSPRLLVLDRASGRVLARRTLPAAILALAG